MAPNEPLSHDEQVYAIKTWRYLRLAMVVLVVGVAVSIGFERWKAGCFQGSISAYYYTPVRGFFVGALMAIGACLVCLKGNTEREDLYLNLAGMFAPVVALVPTPGTGHCASVLGTNTDRNANISNNAFALLSVGLIALLILAWLVRHHRPPGAALLGYAVAVAVWLVGSAVFVFGHGTFVRDAHYTAAVLMFVCIFLVVRLNAQAYQAKTRAANTRNRYGLIASAMPVAAVVIGVAAVTGWGYWVLAIEATEIVLFALFWVTQTKELWHEGLR